MNKINNNILNILFFAIIFFGCKEESDDPVVKAKACRNLPEDKYIACVAPSDSTTLDVATWNIEFFPQKSNTPIHVEEIINSFHADVIALQEISDLDALDALDTELEDWEAQAYNSGSLNLGFIYNTCEISSVTDIKALDLGDFYAFPRQPVEITITHTSGMQITLINLHLKCCDDGYERRIAASEHLKEYVDTQYPNSNVIILGDFNDEIEESETPFNNFIGDEENYLFADMPIAMGGSNDFSYPSYPSHIDHILISNELFNRAITTKTIKLEECYSSYSNMVSDHRPVILSLETEEL